MANQWFIDLDGAKSGPYQTQEVLSLVAEGEILPHHLISPNLKDGPWVSVLEWRLAQAKLLPEEKPVESPSITSQPNYKPTPSATPVTQPASSQPIHSPKNTPSPYIPPEEPSTGPRKDPTAEMFDVLQRSKQKREEKLIEKQIQSEKAQSTPSSYSEPQKTAQSASPSGGSGSLFKTLGTGLLISIFGFWLGQWFQQKSTQTQPTAQIAPPVATPTLAPEPVAEHSPAQHEPVQVMEDRSTDKMTIRGKVAAKPATMPSNSVADHAEAPPGQPTGNVQAAAPSEPAKDIKELQDLKKELEELKNLKKELQNSIHEDGFENDAEQPEYPDGSGPGNGVD